MDNQFSKFRSAFMGFNRQDVRDYIASSVQEKQAEIQRLTEENQQLAQENSALREELMLLQAEVTGYSGIAQREARREEEERQAALRQQKAREQFGSFCAKLEELSVQWRTLVEEEAAGQSRERARQAYQQERMKALAAELADMASLVSQPALAEPAAAAALPHPEAEAETQAQTQAQTEEDLSEEDLFQSLEAELRQQGDLDYLEQLKAGLDEDAMKQLEAELAAEGGEPEPTPAPEPAPKPEPASEPAPAPEPAPEPPPAPEEKAPLTAAEKAEKDVEASLADLRAEFNKLLSQLGK